jgi:ribonuclease H2 subunit B
MPASSQWVMITEESNLEVRTDIDCRPAFCQLRHPKSGEAILYMFTDGGQRVHDVMTFDEDGRRSWFVGNLVLSDGSMIVTTPVDPVFLVLPYLIQASKTGKFMSVECLLVDSELPECRRLAACCSANELCTVADVKDAGGDCNVYRYNSEKTLVWLRQKVEALVSALQQNDVNANASVATFIRSKCDAESSNDEYIKYACGMICEYLSNDLSQLLTDSLGLKDDAENYANEDMPHLKRARLESALPMTPVEDYSMHGAVAGNRKPEKLTNAQKQLSKVDKKGIKSISSFFTAKAAAK